MKSVKAALVGADIQDNLALRYLASSAERAGHEVVVVPFNGASEIERCIHTLTELKPDVVGLGIAFQYAIADYTDIATRLRRDGFSGHITCGEIGRAHV